MKIQKRWWYAFLVFVLFCGLALDFLAASPVEVRADDPPPPAEESQPVTDEPQAPPAPTPKELELRQALDALETARRQSPEAVVALIDTLRGPGLDAVMGDIVAAREQIARAAPPRPPTPPLSLAEEEAALAEQAASEAESRAAALAVSFSPEADAPDQPEPQPTGDPSAPAADRTVGSPPCTYATVAEAVTAANPGDRLLLEGGVTFVANLSITKNLTIQGGYNGCGSGSTARTTLDGGGSARVMYIFENLNITLEKLNITNGAAPGNGGGILVRWNSQVTGTDVAIYGNTATGSGGGVRLLGSTATFTDSEINNNTAQAGAGVHGELYNGYAPALNLPSSADVHDNQTVAGTGYGGGVYLSEGTVSLTDCSDIYSNDATVGGGAYLITSTLTIAGDCSEIMINTATGNGGGVYALDSTLNLDDGAELYNNAAGSEGGTGSGGGAYLDNSTLWGDKALIYYNSAHNYGGGVYAAKGSLVDMDLGGFACNGPRCSQISHNSAETLYGGGAYASGSSEIDLRQVFIESNSAVYGGGLYALQSPVFLYNTLVARNDASGNVGDGLRLTTGSSLTGQHNTLAYNDANGAATGAAVSLNSATVALSNSIIWGHTTSLNQPDQTITCSDIQGTYTGTGNLNLDPLFVASSSSNFHLGSTSPVLDRCAAGQSLDFDNEVRPVTYIRPGTPYDMGADEATTRVGINGGACAYGRIQDAVDAAGIGATIQAVGDVFLERVNLNGKTLTIAGGFGTDCTTDLGGITTLNGSGGGRVFTITNSRVTLRDLAVTGGDASSGGGVGVMTGISRVTLDNTDVFANHATYGGGLYIDAGNVLTITNDTDVYDNLAGSFGGGARVWGKLVGDDWASTIDQNAALNGGGVSVPGGELYLDGSHVMENHADPTAGLGGGIHVYGGGVVTAIGSSNIRTNSAFDGAGIYADGATVNLDAVVHSNAAANNGGGVYLTGGSSLSTNNTYIGYYGSGWGGNTAIDGAGLYLDNSTLDFAGSIIHNVASSQGGGIYASASTLHLHDSQVGGTAANQPNQLGASGHEGVGLYLTNGTHATLAQTLVTSNAFQTAGYTYGGGAYITGGSVMTLTHSTIQLHQALASGDGRGAGVYLDGGVLTLDASQVISNTADTIGGGIRMYGTSQLNVLNGSELNGNQSVYGAGGAVAADGTPDIHISGSMLKVNTAGTHGGAVFLNAGTLDFAGWWGAYNNSAGGNGGAVAVLGTGDARFAANTAGSSLIGNHADGNGGALYLNNGSTLELYSTYSYLLSVSGNTAGGNGGAAYADAGGMFDVYGRVVFTVNEALGNGGAVFLSNSSKIWLDDFIYDVPEMRENWADNGGAIYALNSPSVECDGAMFGAESEGNMATSGSGGAVYVENSIFSAENCAFTNNQASLNGGAIAAYASALNIVANYPDFARAAEGSAVPVPQEPQRILATDCNPSGGECSRFSGNLADSDGNGAGDGGAIFSNDSTLILKHTYLHDNQARTGGAIYQTGAAASGEVSNTLIYGNLVTAAFGSGIRNSGGPFTLAHVTIADNVGGSGFSGASNTVANTIAWGNSTGGFTLAPTSPTCNIDQSGVAGAALDPQFADPGAGEDYHLTSSSPAVDACGTGLSPDLDNVPRPYGDAYDMGAYEYSVRKLFLPLVVR